MKFYKNATIQFQETVNIGHFVQELVCWYIMLAACYISQFIDLPVPTEYMQGIHLVLDKFGMACPEGQQLNWDTPHCSRGD